MARAGWSIKAAGAVLGIHPNKVTQAITPAFTKVAKLLLADPAATCIEMMEAIRRVQAEREISSMRLLSPPVPWAAR